MKKSIIAALLFSFMLCSFMVIEKTKKEKHYGKVKSVLGDYEGYIFIKLNEENDEMIEVELVSETKKEKGSKTTTSSSIKLNAKTIRSMVIDSINYDIRDIEYAYGKYYKNCCIKKEATNGNVGLYAWGTETNASKYSLLFSNASSTKVFKVVAQISILSSFMGCDDLKKKIRAKEAGYSLTENSTDEERLAAWRKWIEESKDCVKK